MEPLAKEAIRVVQDGTIKFVPERFTKNYMNWMKNTRDWCISRQLWWGHQIPAWYCADCGAATVAKSAPAACPHCGSTNLTQDPDTLDTWFSSALWPFSTLGWPPVSRATTASRASIRAAWTGRYIPRLYGPRRAMLFCIRQ